MITLLMLWCCALGFAEGAYFFVEENSEKCFHESLPKGITMFITYNNIGNPGVTSKIVIKDYASKILHTTKVTADNSSGKIAWHTQDDGDHWVCVVVPPTSEGGEEKFKWSLSIEEGEREVDLSNSAKKHEVASIYQRGIDFLSRVKALIAQEDYQRRQEEEFQLAHSSIADRVIALSLLQVLMMICVTVFCIFHLKRFFKSQELF